MNPPPDAPPSRGESNPLDQLTPPFFAVAGGVGSFASVISPFGWPWWLAVPIAAFCYGLGCGLLYLFGSEKSRKYVKHQAHLVIAVMAIALLVIVGSVGYEVGHDTAVPSSTPAPPRIVPTVALTAPALTPGGTHPGIGPPSHRHITPAPTRVPPTARGTAARRVIWINRQMPCTDCSADDTFTLDCIKAVVSPSDGTVSLQLRLTNLSNTTYHYVSIEFVKLQDEQTGQYYSGSGDDFSSLVFTPGQRRLFNPTFPFTPPPHRTYSLSAEILPGFDYVDFSPIDITL